MVWIEKLYHHYLRPILNSAHNDNNHSGRETNNLEANVRLVPNRSVEMTEARLSFPHNWGDNILVG